MSETQGRCPQDGGFLGDAGCTHPNHKHSEFLRGMLASKPRDINPGECSSMLHEGFYVKGKSGVRMGFGKTLSKNIEAGGSTLADERKRNLLRAVDTVKNTEPSPHVEAGFEGRLVWVNKSVGDKTLVVVSSKDKGDGGPRNIEYVFTVSEGGKTHTPQEVKRIAEYKASTDEKVVKFVREMAELDNNERNKRRITICETPKRLGDKIEELTGTNPTGWDIDLHGNHVRHTEKRHGSEGKHDRSLSDIEHYGRLAYVMRNFDSVELVHDSNGAQVFSEEYRDAKNRPSPVVNIKMRIDGTIAVQEAVQDAKRKKLQIVSARIGK